MNKRRFLAGGVLALLLTSRLQPAAAEGSSFTVDAQVALEAYRAVVEEHLTGILNALKAVARSSEAMSGDWKQVQPLVAELAKDIVSQAAVWYALPDGSYDTAAGGPTEQSLSDRDYFPGLMAGKDVLGALVVSKSTGHRSVIVATPVMVNGKAVAALGVSVRARLLSELVTTRTAMPAGLTFYTLDPAGRTVLHKDPDRMFHYPSDMGDPSLNQAVAEIMSRPSGALSYASEGKDHALVYTASPVTGWKFVLVREKH